MKVHVSGGNSSRRQLLSTSEFMLSKYLFLLGISDHSVYNSSILHKAVNNSNVDFNDMVNIEVPVTFFKLLIGVKMDKIIKLKSESIKRFEKDISNFRNNIRSVEESIKIKMNKKAKIDSSIVITDMPERSKKSIEQFQQLILEKEKEILEIKSELSDIHNSIENLFNSTYDNIKDFYINYFHNESNSLNSKKRIKQFSKNIILHKSKLSSNANVNSTSLDRRE